MREFQEKVVTDNGLERYSKALRLLERQEHPDVALAYMNGTVYTDEGDSYSRLWACRDGGAVYKAMIREIYGFLAGGGMGG